jgi:hypothetical protein
MSLFNCFRLFALIVGFVGIKVNAVTTACIIESKNKWNNCGIPSTVRVGDILKIAVTPPEQKWTDFYIPTTADGFTNPFPVALRFPGEKLFKLICCMNEKEDSTCQAIGKAANYVVNESGYLSCYANDQRYFYWNNFGSLNIKISSTGSSDTTANSTPRHEDL